jgi:hypothetical protein
VYSSCSAIRQSIGADRAIVPEIESGAPIRPSRDHNLDSLVFDKADQVERVEDLRVWLTALDKEIADLEVSAKTASVEEAEKAKETIFLLQKIRERLVEKIAVLEAEVSE